MPRILRILNRFNLGGPIHSASLLARYLAPEFETLLVGGIKEEAEGDGIYICRDHGLDPIVIPELRRPINPVNDISAYKQICSIIADYKPDIVHTHAAKAGLLGRIASHHLKVPVIVHTYHGHVFHSYFHPATSGLYQMIERRLATITSKLVALSPCQHTELTQTYKVAQPQRFAIIPPGLELDRFAEDLEQKRFEFRQNLALEPDELAIGIIGRLTKIKNHKLFLDSFAETRKRTSMTLRGVIIGDGELADELRQYCSELGLSHHSMNDTTTPRKTDIVFTSWQKKMDHVYPGLDIVALTSRNEGTPITLIEAQAAGIPVVATDIGGTAAVLSAGKTGLLAKRDDFEDFTIQLLKLIKNEPLRKAMGTAGPNFVTERFHRTRLIADMRKLYYNLLKSG